MRLHVVGLPWTATTTEYLTCAYTQKLLKFGRMMEPRGHEVVLYAGSEENEAPCTEHVPVISEAERASWFGEWGSDALLKRVTWDNTAEPWRTFNERAVRAISERADDHDLVLLVGGNCQQPVHAALVDRLLPVEPFVGYEGVFTHAAYESHAWRSHVYGLMSERNGRFFDATIPNYFDPDDFAVEPRRGGDYVLFVGRLVQRKGPHVAAQLAEAVGMPLVVAGPGGVESGPGYVRADEILVASSAGVDYVGEVGVEERAELMANAACLLSPTLYIEPFGGVAVEAMMAGTPVLATDWGAFTETVVEGLSGWRFRTLAEGVEAFDRLGDLDAHEIQDYAWSRYGLAAVAPQFERWFRQLDSLWREGWNELPEEAAAAA
jgi:glycosyltransferase involved in cell wall biosynthesis